jgi:hypothetical protein
MAKRTRKLHIDDLGVNDRAQLGSRPSNRFVSTFLGWRIEDGAPRAHFVDDDGTEWDAYLFEGKFCVGSSADELRVYAVVGPRDEAKDAAQAVADLQPGTEG